MHELNERTAVVIGGGGGIGRGISLGLAHEGMRVVVADIEAASAEAVRREIVDSGHMAGLVVGNLSSTSARNRPERFGGPTPDPRAGRPPSLAAMPNEQIGPVVLRGIKDNRLYIFTHPESVSLLQRRHEQVLDDFGFYERSAGSG